MAALAWLLLTLVGQGHAGDLAWFSADVAGRLQGCGSCPRDAGFAPSFAQRVAWWREQAGPNGIWVDAGGFLVGPDTLASRGKVMVAAYNAAGVRAAHVTSADLWMGLQPSLEALESAQFPRFSANLFDAESSERLFDPFVVLDLAGERLAVLGVSAQPVQPLAGVRVAPAAETLAQALEELEGLEPGIPCVLCLHGNPSEWQSLPKELLGRFRAVIQSGASLDAALGLDAPPVMRLRNGASEMASADAETHWQWNRVEVPRQGPADASILETTQAYPGLSDLFHEPVAPATEDAALLDLSARNRGMQVEVWAVRHEAQWQGQAAPEGFEWLVLETEWENKLARDLRQDLKYPEAVHIASIERQVLLRVGGALRRPAFGAPRSPAQRIFLSGPGEFVAQQLVYPVALGTTPRLELCVYHDQFAALRIPLQAEDPSQPAPEGTEPPVGVEPVARAENEVVVFELFEPPQVVANVDGGALWQADVLGHSKVLLSTDGRALDREAALESQAPLGKPLEYLMADEMVALVDSQGRHYFSQPYAGADPVPMLDCESSSAVRWRFVLPEGVEPIELWAPFPGLKFTHEDQQRNPEPLGLAWAAHEPSAAHAEEPLQRCGGKPIAFDLIRAERLGDELRVEFELSNNGPDAGFLEPLKRLELRDSQDRALKQVASSVLGLPASGRLWLTAGERRYRVALSFAGAGQRTSASLTFRAVDGERHVNLSWADGPVLAGASAPVDERPNPITAPGAEDVATPADPSTPADPPTTPLPEPPPEPKGLAGVGLTGQQVNRAIDLGADFLWQHIQDKWHADGDLSDLGAAHPEEALALLALAHAGLQKRNPEFATALGEAVPRLERYLTNTYANAVVCMLLDFLENPANQPMLVRAAKILIEGQSSDGTWGYRCPDLADGGAQAAQGYVTVFEQEPTLLERESPWPEKPQSGDNSVGQFVLMGLRSAQRRGVEIPAETWKRAEDTMRARQNTDGGWGYVTDRGYGSMTCAGMGALAVTRWGQGAPLGLDSPEQRKAMEWMSEHYQPGTNPKRGKYNYYYMYSSERVGRLWNVEFFGQHEWYPQGARFLVQGQAAEGSWTEENDSVKATSFALLFLTRATESLEEPVVEATTGVLEIEALPVPESAVYLILDASGSMRAKLEGRSKLDWARSALLDAIGDLPESVEVGLRVYGHRLRAIDDGADRDSELVMPIGPLNAKGRADLESALAALRPKGKTPMAYSLEQSARDFGSVTNGTVILLTDGGEDTRERLDPVAAAAAFAKNRRWSLTIVGFDIGKPAWQDQLEQMAQAAGGAYLTADQGAELLPSVRAALQPLPDTITVEPRSGGPAQSLALPVHCELAGGEYLVRFQVGAEAFEIPIRVPNGGQTRIVLDPAHFQRPNEQK
ncbi:MAG: VWA domain-containing protein [Planctomycetes bacterium]|nr:VWA domain-containing protein [Planctomycetota bacterium]